MEPIISSGHEPAEAIEPEAYAFRELDNQRIGLGPESWVALVVGVHILDREGWVQIASKDGALQSVVVHIWAGTTPQHVKLALLKWGQTPAAERPLVINAGRGDVH